MADMSPDEVRFHRVLYRMKQMSRENFADNLYRLKALLARLEEFFTRLQDDEKLDTDVLMQYGREVYQMRILIEAEEKETPSERLRWVNLIPNAFPESSRKKEEDGSPDGSGAKPEVDSHSPTRAPHLDGLKARNRAVYVADLREQLLGSARMRKKSEGGSMNEVLRREGEKQEELAEELKVMATILKQTYTTAGSVIKEDNVTLSRLQDTADRNRSRLEVESRRLEEHAYRSWCDCLYVVVVCMVIFSFIAMVLIMKVFTKKYY